MNSFKRASHKTLVGADFKLGSSPIESDFPERGQKRYLTTWLSIVPARHLTREVELTSNEPTRSSSYTATTLTHTVTSGRGAVEPR